MDKLYKITNTVNGHSYVGFTSRSINERYSSHKNNAFRQNRKSKLYSAMRKYGVDCFVIEQIYEGVDALQKENYYITYYNCEYNMTAGGESNQLGRTWNMSEETKRKLRKPKPPRTEEHKRNLSKSLTGRKLSEETKKKIGNSSIGNQHNKGNTNRAKTYLVTYPNGNKEIVYNISEFARIHNLNKTCICAVCKGKRSHTKGYKFEYYVTNK